MPIKFFKEYIATTLHDNAEYISGGFTWMFSFITLNIHFTQYGELLVMKFASGCISLLFTGLAVFITHFLKRFLDSKFKSKE